MAAQKSKVWIIDDETELAHLCAEALSADPIETEVFAKAEDALSKIETEKVIPDLFITDFRMPGMSGGVFLKTLRNLKIEKPVILISAATDREQLIEATQNSLTAFLEKPFNFDDLRKIVVTSLQNQPHLDVDAEIMGLLRTHATRLEELLASANYRAELFKRALKEQNPDLAFNVENSRDHFKAVQNERRLLKDIDHIKERVGALWDKSDFSK